MSYTAGHPSVSDVGSDTDQVLAELIEVLRAPGCIHPGLAAMVSAHASSLREHERRRLRGTAFDGRLFTIEEAVPPQVRPRTLV